MNTNTVFLVTLLAFAGCSRSPERISGPLKQRGYIWQREWNTAVIDAVGEADRQMDGVVLLGAEVDFSRKKPEIVKASIDWEAVKRQTKHCSLALRVSPYAGPFRTDDTVAHTIVDLAKGLISEARAHDVQLEEFQFDFDCARKNLGAYRMWLRSLRAAIHPVRFVITTLPAWLDDSEFPAVVHEADGYVLQIHSVPISNNGAPTLCDTKRARQWIDQAAKIGMPFSVALPTYRCAAGYGPDGKLLSVAMDSVQPAWPPGTRVLEFGTNADDLAQFIGDLQKAAAPELQELLWYRVPISTDARNWRWATLSAVMQGRAPEHKIDIVQEGANPIDLSIVNGGEADEQFNASVTAIWTGADLMASDALSGWQVRFENGRAVFGAITDRGVRLPPGAARRIGWLRFDRPTSLETELSKPK